MEIPGVAAIHRGGHGSAHKDGWGSERLELRSDKRGDLRDVATHVEREQLQDLQNPGLAGPPHVVAAERDLSVGVRRQ
jgi:hypothetical protein